MRCLTIACLCAVGAVCLVPDTSDAGIIFGRRRHRGAACCYAAPMNAGPNCCAPGYVGPMYGAPMYAGGFEARGAYPHSAMYPPAGLPTELDPNAAAGGRQPMPMPSPAVAIHDDRFQPNMIQIRPGDTVRWMNQGKHPHTVTADDNSWDSGDLASGKSFTKTFDKPGTFKYHCELHKEMKGTVVVGERRPEIGKEPPPKGPGY